VSFLREVFSEEGQGSASRVMMALHAIAGISFVVVHLMKNGHLPDFSGVTLFVTAPYAINKLGSAADSFAARPKL
jgi:hypothetical protein